MNEREQPVLYLPQELYDKLMALPEGTDVTEYFEFSPGWDLKVTVTVTEAPTGAEPGAAEEPA